MSVADLAGARLALIKAKDWPSLSDVMRELLMHTALHGEMVPVTTVKEGDYLSGRLVTGIHPGDRG